MAVLSSLIFGLLASVAVASPTPIQDAESQFANLVSRAVISHDAVVGFAEKVPATTQGTLYEAYQPFLKVNNGCVPFPAVDAAGNTGGGLATSGSSNGGCSSSTGQIYSRSATYGAYYAIMYSWYFPKDEPSDGLGHRHDWEGVVVWLKSGTATTAANIVAVCPSAHGGWDCSTSFSLSGTGALIKYESVWPVNHACGLTSTVGGQQPLIAWESLTSAAQTALTNTDFGSANVPFKDANFNTNLGKCTW